MNPQLHQENIFKEHTTICGWSCWLLFSTYNVQQKNNGPFNDKENQMFFKLIWSYTYMTHKKQSKYQDPDLQQKNKENNKTTFSQILTLLG